MFGWPKHCFLRQHRSSTSAHRNRNVGPDLTDTGISSEGSLALRACAPSDATSHSPSSGLWGQAAGGRHRPAVSSGWLPRGVQGSSGWQLMFQADLSAECASRCGREVPAQTGSAPPARHLLFLPRLEVGLCSAPFRSNLSPCIPLTQRWNVSERSYTGCFLGGEPYFLSFLQRG